MTLRVKYEDLELIGFDSGGGEIMNYNGQLFTGIIEEIRNGILVGEFEFTNGHEGGVQRGYYPNGQIQEEFFIYFNKLEGIFRERDEDGTLTSTTHWKNGVQITAKQI